MICNSFIVFLREDLSQLTISQLPSLVFPKLVSDALMPKPGTWNSCLPPFLLACTLQIKSILKLFYFLSVRGIQPSLSIRTASISIQATAFSSMNYYKGLLTIFLPFALPVSNTLFTLQPR